MRAFAVIAFSATTVLPQLVAAGPVQQEVPPAAGQPIKAITTQTTVPAASQPTTQTTAAESSRDEIICKMTPPKTGSRLGGGRECHTQREWDRRMRESQTILGGSQLRGLEGNTSGH